MPTMTAEKTDLYAVLKVDRNASSDEIKRAYRDLAPTCHPDKFPGDEEKAAQFVLIARAKDVLGNEQKRAIYDRYGEYSDGLAEAIETLGETTSQSDRLGDIDWGASTSPARPATSPAPGFAPTPRAEAAPGAGPHDASPAAGTASSSGPAVGEGERPRDRFDTMFRRPAGASPAPRRDAAGYSFGATARREQPRGAAPARRPEDLEVTLDLTFDEALEGVTKMVSVERKFACAACRGRGTSACPKCHGMHVVTRRDEVGVVVRPGTEDGTVIRVTGQGTAGTSGAAGDLLVRTRVAPHPFFIRRGADILLSVPLTPFEAANGTRLMVPTLEGYTSVEVTAGTRAGESLRLGGLGAPSVASPERRGDLIVEFVIALPQTVTGEMMELLKRFDELSAEYPRALFETHGLRERRFGAAHGN